MAAPTYNTITVTDSATLIIGASSARRGLVIANEGTVNVFIGPNDSITTANAMPLYPSEKFTNSAKHELWAGAVYGIVATGTADVRFWAWDDP